MTCEIFIELTGPTQSLPVMAKGLAYFS